jgi:PAS domain S-box-containing protein
MKPFENLSAMQMMAIGLELALVVLMSIGVLVWRNTPAALVWLLAAGIVGLLAGVLLLFRQRLQSVRDLSGLRERVRQAEQGQGVLDQRWRDQQFYTRSLFESNIDALMAIDQNGLVNDLNCQMEVLTGWPRAELIGAPFRNLFTDPERADSVLAGVLHEGRAFDCELTVRAKDGREAVVSYNAATYNDRDGRLCGVFASARDVTGRKRFESQLEAANLELQHAKAAAEKANQAKSEFLSGMSHELRTPLNVMLGFAQLLASSQPPPPAAQKTSIDQILRAGWYLLSLINEVLDLATIEAGKVRIVREAMALSDVLQECQSMIQLQADRRGISMVFPDFSKPFPVLADRTRVKQMMLNLLSNAIKYNVDGGGIIVDCVMRDERWVRITVVDNGIGMTEEQISHLYQPFNRLGQEGGNQDGTGIGLVVTRQLVELMGGEMGVKSEAGVGSTFWVELEAAALPTPAVCECMQAPDAISEAVPAAQPRQAGLHPFCAPLRINGTPNGTPHTLLYVEDNAPNLALVDQLIARRSDLRLLLARDGKSGISLAQVAQPDVILLDINLPRINGLTVLETLRKDAATAHIPVLALSANASGQAIEAGLAAGFFRYLTKPVKVDELMQSLDLALTHVNGRRAPASPGAQIDPDPVPTQGVQSDARC